MGDANASSWQILKLTLETEHRTPKDSKWNVNICRERHTHTRRRNILLCRTIRYDTMRYVYIWVVCCAVPFACEVGRENGELCV